jgi:DivIVA domain-containing protein
MIDESFRVTPVEVRNQQFARTMRGYDPGQVEEFRGRVADELEKLIRQNLDLDTKVKNLIEQLRAYRERDKALNDALVSAQQLRSEIREHAEREAQLILREARAEGERLLEGTRAEIRKLELELTQLEKSRRAYLGQLRAIVERQLAELDATEAAPPRPSEPTRAEDFDDPRAAKKTPDWLDSLIKE